ncbi:MAG: ABC transporter ATP-binding protein [Lentisphaeraceae bacterium]|nr:ABC transporter ATP-binding protein [Lentisphaeraceae bacterium]
MSLITLENITRQYDVGGKTVHALKALNLEIKHGEFMAIFGKSGSGKSTLLNILGLLDPPTNGEYLLEGQNVSHLDDNAMAALRCRKIGMIFQSFNLMPHFNVMENICIPMQYAGVPRQKMQERARYLASRLGLEDRLYHKPTELSGGQCQRIAIARSLANDPPVILADEPTGNLDEKTGQEVIEIFQELVAEGKTIIMVTHNPEYEEIVERTISLKDGVML